MNSTVYQSNSTIFTGMKILLLLFVFFNIHGHSQSTIPLKKCPPTPNCICTYSENLNKNAPTLPFKGSLTESHKTLFNLITNIDGTVLVEDSANYLHFEFHTSFGDFIDDVEFYFDAENHVIHFRSASRKGYGDFGANKRRMKQIRKQWSSI